MRGIAFFLDNCFLHRKPRNLLGIAVNLYAILFSYLFCFCSNINPIRWSVWSAMTRGVSAYRQLTSNCPARTGQGAWPDPETTPLVSQGSCCWCWLWTWPPQWKFCFHVESENSPFVLPDSEAQSSPSMPLEFGKQPVALTEGRSASPASSARYPRGWYGGISPERTGLYFWSFFLRFRL